MVASFNSVSWQDRSQRYGIRSFFILFLTHNALPQLLFNGLSSTKNPIAFLYYIQCLSYCIMEYYVGSASLELVK